MESSASPAFAWIRGAIATAVVSIGSAIRKSFAPYLTATGHAPTVPVSAVGPEGLTERIVLELESANHE
jgi:hypothetical protein